MKYWMLSFLFMLLISPVVASAVTNEFQAPWWCRGGHFQTIYGGLFRENPVIKYRREKFELPDGDFLDLDWLDGEKGKPVVLILHGLASSSESAYIKVLVEELHEKGWTAVVMNARGQNEDANRLKITNHGGRSQDAAWSAKHILEVSKTEELYAVGYSLGGNILLKWLGENAGFIPSQLKKAVAVSAAYDLQLMVKHLDTDWFNREVYTRSMLKTLKKFALEKETHFPGILDRNVVANAKTFKVYDREVTAKLNGFKDEIDYWTQSSSRNYLGAITVPTLLIHAANDPFLPGSDLPYREMLQSPNLKLLLTEDGGHLGFVSGKSPWEPKRWLEKKILEYFSN